MQFGPGFAFTFFYYFVMTTIITTVVVANVAHLNLESGMPQQLGVGLGLLAGALGGYFNRTTLFSISSTEPRSLLAKLEQILDGLGYERQEDQKLDDGVICYKHSGIQLLVSGPVYLLAEKQQITVATRSVQLKRIQAQLEEDPKG